MQARDPECNVRAKDDDLSPVPYMGLVICCRLCLTWMWWYSWYYLYNNGYG